MKIIFKSFLIFNIVLFGISFNANAKCAFNCYKVKNKIKIIKLIEKVTNDFKPTLGIPDEISYEQFKKAYDRNKKYCQLGVWSIHFPKENFDVIEPFVNTSGKDFYTQKTNANPFGSFMFRKMLRGVRVRDLSEIKMAFLKVLESNAFTALKPMSFSNMPRNYPVFGDVKAWAYSVLFTMTMSYSVLIEELNNNEKLLFKNWGNKFFQNMSKYDDQVSNITSILNKKGPDRVAVKIMAMAAWGKIMKDEAMFKKALKWYLASLELINKDGFHIHFIKNHKTKEIKYQSSTFGALSVAAYFFETSGFPALDYKNSNGSSLLRGLNIIFEYLNNKPIPLKLPEPQKLKDVTYHSRSNHNTIAFAEYIKLLRPEGISESFNVILKQMRNTGKRRNSQSRNGLYSVIHGGYTTCFLAKDIIDNQ
jgi:hypothetical protein